jgi:hypothetical protein
MADTIRGSFKNPCADCDRVDSDFHHSGPLVPSGACLYLCAECLHLRDRLLAPIRRTDAEQRTADD